jgi:hypothetical protein
MNEGGRAEVDILVDKLMKGDISKEEVREAINGILQKYGEGAFNSYRVTRHMPPYSEKDIDELKVLAASGAASKEFFEYWADVNEYVRLSAKTKNKKGGFVHILIIAGRVAIVIFVVMCIVFAIRVFVLRN